LDHSIDAALGLWTETAGGRATLVNLSENQTFRVDGPNGTYMLRVHRPGYQSLAGIRSELAWLTALRTDTDLPIPRPVPGRDGELIQEIAQARTAVLFAYEQGREPTPADDLVPIFRRLGHFAATTHLHTIRWRPPADFTRPTWDASSMLDADGLWGDWRLAPNMTPEIRRTLDALEPRLRAALAAYGKSPDRFGLIHGDMRLGNLLLDGDRLTLLDFDDCGFGWFVYDLAASLSFIETRAELPALIAAWLDAYQKLRPLTPADVAMIEPMILLRRMVLLAWIGSHGETALAQAHAENFAADTAMLAERWM
jgi:Ser/Thr protein kinase RdoA (MazF antagonist)